jgi:hypothetical protein
MFFLLLLYFLFLSYQLCRRMTGLPCCCLHDIQYSRAQLEVAPSLCAGYNQTFIQGRMIDSSASWRYVQILCVSTVLRLPSKSEEEPSASASGDSWTHVLISRTLVHVSECSCRFCLGTFLLNLFAPSLVSCSIRLVFNYPGNPFCPVRFVSICCFFMPKIDTFGAASILTWIWRTSRITLNKLDFQWPI